jgi:phage gpG-like protein
MTSRRGRTSGPTLIQRSRQLRPGEKALFHNVAGAGKARTTREFFTLDASDEQALTEELGRRVQRNLHSRG